MRAALRRSTCKIHCLFPCGVVHTLQSPFPNCLSASRLDFLFINWARDTEIGLIEGSPLCAIAVRFCCCRVFFCFPAARLRRSPHLLPTHLQRAPYRARHSRGECTVVRILFRARTFICTRSTIPATAERRSHC